jgi:adenylate kinase
MRRYAILPQVEHLDEIAKKQGFDIEAIEVDVPIEELMKRLTGRRSCPVCGEIYNIYSKPPANDNVCDRHPDVKLDHRADDNEESVAARLATYDRETRPLIDYYERSGRLKRVDGTGEVEEIFSRLEDLV